MLYLLPTGCCSLLFLPVGAPQKPVTSHDEPVHTAVGVFVPLQQHVNIAEKTAQLSGISPPYRSNQRYTLRCRLSMPD